jgi:xanthine dehydrogenase YagR molybdenum-binding subunit
MQTRADDEFGEQTATVSRALYAAPHRMTRHRLVPLDLRDAQPVRGPGELPGLLAAESAMDELAYVLGIDPLALRIRNEPDRDPERGVPFAGRRLVECMVEGARRFGWANRPLTPASRREGRLLVGYGMAAEMRMHFQQLSKARVHLSPDCKITVRTDMTDIGTGTYTILAQVAAQELGTDAADVQVLLGDSDYPVSAGSGGSWGAANSSVAVARACRTLRQRLAESGGHIGPGGIEAEGETAAMTQEHNYQEYSHHTYGANFAEVTVDIDTGEVRVRRMLGVFCAGRIVNPKTARSQIIGGMIWGIGSALFEEATVDPRYGHFVNRDLAEYNIAAHADIPAVDAVLLDDFDERANEMGIKGVGELGVCGSGAAIANAVFNATGVRVREFPITLDKILAGSPPAI